MECNIHYVFLFYVYIIYDMVLVPLLHHLELTIDKVDMFIILTIIDTFENYIQVYIHGQTSFAIILKSYFCRSLCYTCY